MAQLVSLHSKEASIVLEHDPRRGLLWRHCGARVETGALPPLSDCRGPASFALNNDIAAPMVPPAGLGWFGPAVVEARSASGEAVLLVADSCDVIADEARIAMAARDSSSGLEYRLTIERLSGGAFRFSPSIVNQGAARVLIDAAASLQLPLPATAEKLISWQGRHNAELVECVEPMPRHTWQRAARRGISGHGGPPGFYVLDGDAGWHSGLVYAVQLAWSGDSALTVEHDDEGFWTLAAQASLAPGEIALAPGEAYDAPPAILAISTKGRNGAMQQHHAAVRSLLQWPGGTMRPRPVHLNSWEACYFDHAVARIERLARAAVSVGIERFVLDDGWFKGRRDDTAALGDWEPDPVTYPDGLAPLARAVEAMGMEFGLWVEPEMISPDSDLYRAHPDWALAVPGRERPEARNQLVIDMRRAQVRDHLLARLDALLAGTPIGYLKWDHNRDHAPGGGTAQTRGTYDLLARLRAAHPAVEIEGCAGGGGRSDAGLAPFVHRFWASDNIDAAARVAMQRGFLAFLPPELMGSHIGASPAHATGRSQSMAFRAAVACMGHLGVELDPEALAAAEREELARWIAFYKRWRHVLHSTPVDLGEGADGLVWQAQGNRAEKLLFAIRTAPPQDRRPQPLRLPFAAAQARWNISLLAVAEHPEHGLPRAALFDRMAHTPVTFTGDWLAAAGLPMPVQKAESVAIFHLDAIP
jgi:alpha-galactosidase